MSFLKLEEELLAYTSKRLAFGETLAFSNVLQSATASFAFAREDWGVDYYNFIIRIPQDDFVNIADNKSSFESRIESIVREAIQPGGNEGFSSVYLLPDITLIQGWRGGVEQQRTVSSEIEWELWGDAPFRLFLSHKSNERVFANQVAERLRVFGVRSFVAHDAIEFTKPWAERIAEGLKTMHGMAMLCTDGYRSSTFCNQEVGWAMSRGVAVAPVAMAEDPPGFPSSIQGPRARLDNPSKLASDLISFFLLDARTHSHVISAIRRHFEGDPNWGDTAHLISRMRETRGYTIEDIDSILTTCNDNKNFAKAMIRSRHLPDWAQLARKQLAERIPVASK